MQYVMQYAICHTHVPVHNRNCSSFAVVSRRTIALSAPAEPFLKRVASAE